MYQLPKEAAEHIPHVFHKLSLASAIVLGHSCHFQTNHAMPVANACWVEIRGFIFGDEKCMTISFSGFHKQRN